MSTQVIDRMAVEVEVEGEGRRGRLHPRPRRHLQHLHAAHAGAGQPLSDRAPGSAGIGAQPRPAQGALDRALRRGDRTRWPGRWASSAPMSSAIRWAPSSPSIWRCRSRSWCGASRCSARCWRRRTPAAQGLRDRAKKARAEGMAGIADAILQAAHRRPTPAATSPSPSPSCARCVMRQDPEGYARTCEALADARSRRCRADRVPDPAGHRRRGRRRAALRRPRHGASASPVPGSSCCPLRPLDARSSGRGVDAALKEFLPAARSHCGHRIADTASREGAMANTLFTNVRIFDGTGEHPYHRRGAGPGQPHQARRPRQPHRAGQWRTRSSTAPAPR